LGEKGTKGKKACFLGGKVFVPKLEGKDKKWMEGKDKKNGGKGQKKGPKKENPSFFRKKNLFKYNRRLQESLLRYWINK
jgi:hypothetical protein